jgi:hypothetical protein
VTYLCEDYIKLYYTRLMFYLNGIILFPFCGLVVATVQPVILLMCRKVVFRLNLILKWYQRMNFQLKVQKNH